MIMKQKLFNYLNSLDQPTRSQGCWWVIMEDHIRKFNLDNGTAFDPTDSILDYLEQRVNDDAFRSSRKTKTN